jgi:hypothetical protein
MGSEIASLVVPVDADNRLRFLFDYTDILLSRSIADAVYVECNGCQNWQRVMQNGVAVGLRVHPVIVAVNDILDQCSPIP